jgi:ketosteroid isomerase-like protein
MSQENVEVVLQGIEALNRRDVDAFVALVSPDVEWEDSAFWSEHARIYRGEAELREWFDQVVLEPWESIHFEIEEITRVESEAPHITNLRRLAFSTMSARRRQKPACKRSGWSWFSS